MNGILPLLPHPALYASHGGIWIADNTGTRGIGRGEAIARAAQSPLILLNAPLVGQRLGYPELSGLDLLELFAFVHPARFVVPTVKGLAEALGGLPPVDDSAAASVLRVIAASLVGQTDKSDWAEREGAWTSAITLGRLGWPWGDIVGDVIANPKDAERWLFAKLPEWEEKPPRPAPRTISVPPESALERLDDLTGAGAERRDGQRAYT